MNILTKLRTTFCLLFAILFNIESTAQISDIKNKSRENKNEYSSDSDDSGGSNACGCLGDGFGLLGSIFSLFEHSESDNTSSKGFITTDKKERKKEKNTTGAPILMNSIWEPKYP